MPFTSKFLPLTQQCEWRSQCVPDLTGVREASWEVVLAEVRGGTTASEGRIAAGEGCKQKESRCKVPVAGGSLVCSRN